MDPQPEPMISSAPYIALTVALTKPTEITKKERLGLLLNAFNALGRHGIQPLLPYQKNLSGWLTTWESLGRSLCTGVLKLRSERGESSVPNNQGTPLEKAIAGAFLYFPFGFNEPKFHAGWAWGPTFVVRVPQTYDEKAVVALLGDTAKYKELQDYEQKVERLTSEAQRCVRTVTVEKDKHGTCTARRVVVAESGGSLADGDSGVDASFELAFPHVRLLRQLRPDKLTTDGESFYVAAWKDNQLVGYVVGRHPCEEVEPGLWDSAKIRRKPKGLA